MIKHKSTKILRKDVEMPLVISSVLGLDRTKCITKELNLHNNGIKIIKQSGVIIITMGLISITMGLISVTNDVLLKVEIFIG